MLARLGPPIEAPARISSLLVTRGLTHSGVGWTGADLVRAKIVGALGAAAVVAGLCVIIPLSEVLVAAAAYAGFVFPTLYVDRAAARRHLEAERSLITLTEWTEALVASGRPIETALVAVAARGVGAPLLDTVLADAARSYALGAPLFPALAREAKAADLGELARIASELERSRDLGRGALPVLRDERDRLRGRERARGLDAAGRVEGQLTLVVVLCYLPALMLLVVIPLFLGLLAGLYV
jgi:Flp pilus assembly protein TadB